MFLGIICRVSSVDAAGSGARKGSRFKWMITVVVVLLSDQLDEHLMKNDRMIIIYKVEKFWPHTFH